MEADETPLCTPGATENHGRRTVDSSSVTIIVPAFNEERIIRKTLCDLRDTQALKEAKIIVVDDGSKDRTAAMAAGIDGVRVLHHRHNVGYGGAIKTGVRAAATRYVCWYDADGQHRPKDLVKLIRRVQKIDADWGLGVRSADSYSVIHRQPGRLLLRMVVQLAARQRVNDFNTGMRIFRTDCLKRYLHLLPNGFSASTTTTLLMIERGYLGANVRITTPPRVGKSQVKPISDGVRMLALIVRIFLLFRALFFFSVAALVLFVAGVAYSAYVMSMRHLGVPVAGLFLMTTGTLTFFMGLIADQLSLIRRERFEDMPQATYEGTADDH